MWKGVVEVLKFLYTSVPNPFMLLAIHTVLV